MEKLEQEHCFLRISMRREEGGEGPESPTQLMSLILQAIQALHGHVGASVPVDILHFHSDDVIGGGARSISAILRAPCREQVKVWSALTLCTPPGSVYTVAKVSTSLLSLAVDSRQFEFPN